MSNWFFAFSHFGIRSFANVYLVHSAFIFFAHLRKYLTIIYTKTFFFASICDNPSVQALKRSYAEVHFFSCKFYNLLSICVCCLKPLYAEKANNMFAIWIFIWLWGGTKRFFFLFSHFKYICLNSQHSMEFSYSFVRRIKMINICNYWLGLLYDFLRRWISNWNFLPLNLSLIFIEKNNNNF